MAVLDTRPDVVDLSHYGGDTLTITITAPSYLVSGMEWTAQIRGAREAVGVDAEFDITPPTVTDGPAFLVLTAAECRRLIDAGGVLVQVQQQRTVRLGPTTNALAAVPRILQRYSGVWDCQIAPFTGGDPVRTLVQGAITIDLDVTREE